MSSKIEKFKVGTIARDDQGYWHVQWYGTTHDQGGPGIGWTNLGMKEIDILLKHVAKNLKSHEEMYDKNIKAKVTNDSSDE